MRVPDSLTACRYSWKAICCAACGSARLASQRRCAAVQAALARVHHATAQQQRLQAVACVALLAHGVFAGAHQVAQRLVHGVGHAHGTELARTRQARKHQRIAPIGLHAVARALGDGRGRNHLTVVAQCGEVALQHEAARARFVDHMHAMALADQAAQGLADCIDAAGYGAQMAYFTVTPGLGQGDVDAVLVDVQASVHTGRGGGRLTHGPSPCSLTRCRPSGYSVVARRTHGAQSTIVPETGHLNGSSHSV